MFAAFACRAPLSSSSFSVIHAQKILDSQGVDRRAWALQDGTANRSRSMTKWQLQKEKERETERARGRGREGLFDTLRDNSGSRMLFWVECP